MSELAQVQAFIAVARAQSFTKAGMRLSLPRSTVSARVRALEERLNVRLLLRTTRRLALTDEGRRYLERCQDAIDRLAEAEAELSRPDELSGTIRLTVPVDMPKRHLARVVGKFAARHPSVRIEIIVTDEVVDLVANNVDIALRGGAPGAAGLVASKLGEARLAFYASPSYAAARLPARMVSDLSEHAVFGPVHRLPKPSAAKDARQVATQNFELAKELAVQAQGIALLPENLCIDDMSSGALLRLSYEPPMPSLPLYLVMPSRIHVPLRVRALAEHLKAPESRSALL